MRLQTIKLIYLKEILDLLRDRRTIISMLVFPLLVKPMIFLGLNYFLVRSISRAQDKQFNLALKQEIGLDGMASLFEQAGFKVRPSDNPRRAVENKETDLGVDVSGETNSPMDWRAPIATISMAAAARVMNSHPCSLVAALIIWF